MLQRCCKKLVAQRPLSVEGGVKKGKEGDKKESMVDGVQSKSKWVVRVVEVPPPPLCIGGGPVAYKGVSGREEGHSKGVRGEVKSTAFAAGRLQGIQRQLSQQFCHA